MNRPEEIRTVLTETTTWFVVGLRDNPSRDAYDIASLLQSHGKRIVPIHPRAEMVHGEQGYATIAEAVAAVGPPDVVDVFVRSDLAGGIADEAIAAGAQAVWFQFGVIDDDAAQRVTDAGITMVMDRCPAVEFPRLLPE
ncbi:MAG: CoA-binding protein [Actinobacteria bacterium]|nr:CoA-binding protein [Actinomycetota bacterium]